jgi:hypothetical protein
MNDITNTSEQDAVINLVVAMDPRGIEEQEAQGQRELVNSTLLPAKSNGNKLEDFEALGFTFGPVKENDPLFREATLPEGWTREGSEHAMWSYLVDERGIQRVSMFYKAAFYDRDAFMSIVNVGAKFVQNYIYTDTENGEIYPVWDERYNQDEMDSALYACHRALDDEWTPENRKAVYAQCLAYLEELNG